MDVWNLSRAIMPCNHESEMRGQCLLTAFFRHIRVAFNYLGPIVTPMAIDAARCLADAACAANVRWLHEPSSISHISLSRKCATLRLDVHNIWINMCGCGAKQTCSLPFCGEFNTHYVCIHHQGQCSHLFKANTKVSTSIIFWSIGHTLAFLS